MMRVLGLLLWAMPAVSTLPAVLQGDAPRSMSRYESGGLVEQQPSMHGKEHYTRSLSSASGNESVEDPLGGSYEYLGCFLDIRDDRVLHSKIDSSDMTPMICHVHCDSMNAAYMGLQFGNECWCSMYSALDYERHGTGTCDMSCAGDSSITCGGDFSFDMFKLNWPSPSDSEEYVACYNEDPEDPVLIDVMRDDGMTPEMCRDHCFGSYSIYYATQYGDECWCGRSSWLADYDLHGEGVCHMKCAGDSEIACGGYDTFSLFRMLSNPVEDDDRPDNDDYTPSPVVSSDDEDDDVYPTDPSTDTAANVVMVSTPSPTTATAMSVTDDGNSSDDPDFSYLVELHNKIRCVHGSGPLTWNEDIAEKAQSFADFLADSRYCGELFPSYNTEYGENLFLCGLDSEYGCYTPDLAMTEFYDNELTGSVDTYGVHATQVLWADTTDIGCGLSQCHSNEYFEILVCNYSPRGNEPDELEDNVQLPVESKAWCGLS